MLVEHVERRIAQRRRAFPDAIVDGYEPLVASMTCDPKDRDVLAAAVRADAEVLVTFQPERLPAPQHRPYDISAVHPDDFLLDQLDLYPGPTLRALRAQGADSSRPYMAVDAVLVQLARAGVPRFADEVRRHL